MASPATCKQKPYVVVGDKGYLYVSFDGVLDSGVTLTGTPTVVEVTTTALTLTDKAVNSSALTLFGQTVAVGKAVQVFVDASAATAGNYRIRITVSTTEKSSAGVRVRDVILKVVAAGEDA